jgi:hypothetical protein
LGSEPGGGVADCRAGGARRQAPGYYFCLSLGAVLVELFYSILWMEVVTERACRRKVVTGHHGFHCLNMGYFYKISQFGLVIADLGLEIQTPPFP